MRFIYQLLVALLLFCFSALHAQSINNIRFEHFTLKDGLSQSSINCILQDHIGFMWFGTQDGLNRYDGNSFKVFRHEVNDETSLSNNFIRCIIQDKNGFIWIGTDYGLNKYNPQTLSFENFYAGPKSSDLSNNKINTLFEDRLGLIWVGTENGGLNAYNPETNSFYSFKHNSENSASISHNTVNTIFEDKNGLLWVGTNGGGLNLFDRENNLFIRFQSDTSDKNTISNNIVLDIFEDSYNRLWVATNNGLSYIDSPNIFNKVIKFINLDKEKVGLKNNIIIKIFEDSKRNIWVATNGGGLSRLIFQEDSIDFFTYENNPFISSSLSNNNIHDIYQDNSGTIWIGTHNGLDKFNYEKQYFELFTKNLKDENSLNDNNIWSVYEDGDILWIGTRGGLNQYNLITAESYSYQYFGSSPNILNNPSVHAIAKSASGEIVIGTVDGVFKVLVDENDLVKGFQQIQYSNKYFKNNIENKVYSLLQDSRGVLWVGTRNGLGKVLPDGSYQFYQSGPQVGTLSNNIVKALAEDNQGTIWVGTDGGLNRVIFDKSGRVRFQSYTKNANDPNSLSNDLIRSIFPDSTGMLWIGTFGGGLNKFNPLTETFTAYTKSNGLSNNVVYGILPDSEGNLWLSSNKGLTKFNVLKSLFTHYFENDGLQSNEFNTGAYFKGASGNLYFGGINGLNRFNPNQIISNTDHPNVVLTNIKVFNQSVLIGKDGPISTDVPFAKEIQLNHNQNNITFEFASLHYYYPEKNQYMYRLVNFEDTWNVINDKRFANYTNLDPGEYVFMVKGSNGNNVWSEEPAQIRVIITPPYYAKPWFKVLLGVLGVVIILLIYKWRVTVIRTQKKVLEYKVRKRTAEVIRQKKEIEKQKFLLEQEKEKTEKLLLNILPEETVEELKLRGKARARSYRKVTVMFTDFINFTGKAEKLKPRELIAELDSFFVQFDEIIEKYGIQKIKTIGDSYMAAGGLPIRNNSNPIDVVLAAFEIQNYMQRVNLEREAQGLDAWHLRIGVNTGELIAGVIGIKRFAYDIWGDTVNTAHRMETTSEIGRVNISGNTYEYVKEFFETTYRGKIEAKHKGLIDMYFIDRIKPALSEDKAGTVPNDIFWQHLNLRVYSTINYKKAEKYIVKLLEEKLPEGLFYHGIHHTLDVCNAVDYIAEEEGVRGDDLYMLKAAALMHDAGFTQQYKENEPIGVELAKEILPNFGFSEEQINIIEQLILATKVPQQPNGLLQEIICDADLDYLGRDDFHQIATTLRDEFKAFGVINGDKQWDEIQLKFLSHHKYFTSFGKKYREAIKLKHIEDVKARLKRNEYTS